MQRLNSLLESEEYSNYLARNRECEKKRIFCKHNWQHLISVARITYIKILEEELVTELMTKWQLANQEQLKEVVYTAAMLHDIGRWQQYHSGVDHAIASADLAAQLLQKYDYSGLEEQVILTAIREHRGRADSDKSILGRLLCSSDNLSRDCINCSVQQKCKEIKNPDLKY
ncbi:MAG: HD domain-containing protein [Bacillota bacterium]